MGNNQTYSIEMAFYLMETINFFQVLKSLLNNVNLNNGISSKYK